MNQTASVVVLLGRVSQHLTHIWPYIIKDNMPKCIANNMWDGLAQLLDCGNVDFVPSVSFVPILTPWPLFTKW